MDKVSIFLQNSKNNFSLYSALSTYQPYRSLLIKAWIRLVPKIFFDTESGK